MKKDIHQSPEHRGSGIEIRSEDHGNLLGEHIPDDTPSDCCEHSTHYLADDTHTHTCGFCYPKGGEHTKAYRIGVDDYRPSSDCNRREDETCDAGDYAHKEISVVVECRNRSAPDQCVTKHPSTTAYCHCEEQHAKKIQTVSNTLHSSSDCKNHGAEKVKEKNNTRVHSK